MLQSIVISTVVESEANVIYTYSQSYLSNNSTTELEHIYSQSHIWLLQRRPASTLALLQRVMHDTARVIFDLKPRAHVTSAIKTLHYSATQDPV